MPDPKEDAADEDVEFVDRVLRLMRDLNDMADQAPTEAERESLRYGHQQAFGSLPERYKRRYEKLRAFE
jgi:hypothetical protein